MLAVAKSELRHVVGVDEHDVATLLDAAVPVVETVDGRVELIVGAHRLQQQPAGRATRPGAARPLPPFADTGTIPPNDRTAAATGPESGDGGDGRAEGLSGQGNDGGGGLWP